MQRNVHKIIFVLVIAIVTSFAITSREKPKSIGLPKISSPSIQNNNSNRGIRIVQEKNPLLAQIRHGSPISQRGTEYVKWLQCSFQIKVGGNSGSGTLCYYDYKTKTGYVISCGHLWGGVFRIGTSENATIVTWYKNSRKLSRPQSYQAEVIFYDGNYDVSLMAFKPDWVPEVYFPIARAKKLTRGQRLHSMGCDHGEEVAHYVVEIIGFGSDPRGGNSLTTQYNSPRPGRSGGGLVDEQNYFVGICWGTSQKNGTGLGYFVPLDTIQKAYKQYNCDFLIGAPLPGLARNLRIIDHNNSNRITPRDFILIPER